METVKTLGRVPIDDLRADLLEYLRTLQRTGLADIFDFRSLERSIRDMSTEELIEWKRRVFGPIGGRGATVSGIYQTSLPKQRAYAAGLASPK